MRHGPGAGPQSLAKAPVSISCRCQCRCCVVAPSRCPRLPQRLSSRTCCTAWPPATRAAFCTGRVALDFARSAFSLTLPSSGREARQPAHRPGRPAEACRLRQRVRKARGAADARPYHPVRPPRVGPTHLFAECFAAGIVPQSCSTAPGTTTAPWMCGQLAACSRSCLAVSHCSRARATSTSWRRRVARDCVRTHISPGQWLTFHVRPDLLAAGRAE